MPSVTAAWIVEQAESFMRGPGNILALPALRAMPEPAFGSPLLGFTADGCGLCQVGVPGEAGIPPRPQRSKACKTPNRSRP